MTTVTLDTLSNTATIFIRNCLRNNITDTQSPARAGTLWIFKGQPEKRTIDFPYIVIEQANEDDQAITIDSETTINNDFRIHIEVWTDDLEDRDVLADEIVKILKNVDSQDSGGDSLSDKGIIFKNSDKSDNDTYKSETELVRLKFVDVTFQYIGS